MRKRKLININFRDIEEIVYQEGGNLIEDLIYSKESRPLYAKKDRIFSKNGYLGDGGGKELIMSEVNLPRLGGTDEKIFWINEHIGDSERCRCVLVNTSSGEIREQRHFILKYKDVRIGEKYLYPESEEEWEEIFQKIIGLRDYNSSTWIYYEL